MKIIKDTNFLNGGTLEIIIDRDSKWVYGQYKGYREDIDEFVHYHASAKCSDNDKFKEKEGIDIVKLKIVRQYYKEILRLYTNYKKNLIKELNKTGFIINHSLKKLKNIEDYLRTDYELIYDTRKNKSKKKIPTKLTEHSIKKLKEDRKKGLTYKELANKYGCSETTASKYCK